MSDWIEGVVTGKFAYEGKLKGMMTTKYTWEVWPVFMGTDCNGPYWLRMLSPLANAC